MVTQAQKKRTRLHVLRDNVHRARRDVKLKVPGAAERLKGPFGDAPGLRRRQVRAVPPPRRRAPAGAQTRNDNDSGWRSIQVAA